MAKYSQKGYEEFLNKVDKNSDEYKIVKNCYDELKRNKFKASKEFFKLPYAFSQCDWHKDIYQSYIEQEKLHHH